MTRMRQRASLCAGATNRLTLRSRGTSGDPGWPASGCTILHVQSSTISVLQGWAHTDVRGFCCARSRAERADCLREEAVPEQGGYRPVGAIAAYASDDEAKPRLLTLLLGVARWVLEKKVDSTPLFVLCGRFRFSRATARSTTLLPREVFQTEIYVRHFDAKNIVGLLAGVERRRATEDPRRQARRKASASPKRRPDSSTRPPRWPAAVALLGVGALYGVPAMV